MKLYFPLYKKNPTGLIIWVWRTWKSTRFYKWNWRLFHVFPYRLKREWAWNHGEDY